MDPPTPEELQTLPRSAFVVVPQGVGYLVVRTKKNRGLEFPGGKAEHGESPQETARREVREELRVELGELIPLLSFVVTTPQGARHLTYGFLGFLLPGQTWGSSDEGTAEVVAADQLEREATYPHQIPYILRLVERVLSAQPGE